VSGRIHTHRDERRANWQDCVFARRRETVIGAAAKGRLAEAKKEANRNAGEEQQATLTTTTSPPNLLRPCCHLARQCQAINIAFSLFSIALVSLAACYAYPCRASTLIEAEAAPAEVGPNKLAKLAKAAEFVCVARQLACSWATSAASLQQSVCGRLCAGAVVCVQRPLARVVLAARSSQLNSAALWPTGSPMLLD